MIAIIQSRLNSKRLPGKSLLKLGKQEMIKWCFQRVEQCHKIDKIILATSKNTLDDPLEDFCKLNNIIIYRGSLDNVVERFCKVLNKYQSDRFFRINGDSPFLDSSLLDRAAKISETHNADIITNVFPKTFPKGQSVELIKSDFFLSQSRYITRNYDKEHVTPYFYKNSNSFMIINFSNDVNMCHFQTSIDTPQDFKTAEKYIDKFSLSTDWLSVVKGLNDTERC